MYGPDIFAVFTARDQKNKANSAFKLPHNSRWFRRAAGGIAEYATIESREPTPAHDSQSEDEVGAVDRLVVTFSELMQLENVSDGIQAGTSTESSHILLGHRGTKGSSSRQYNIAVDDNLRIWLHDYHSMHGTAVGYNGQNLKAVRRNETWILAYEPGTRHRFGEINILSGGLVTKIEFPNHAIQEPDPQYIENLRAFANLCKGGVLGVQGLGLDSQPPTEAPSEAQTVGERPIYYQERRIGKGEFGAVYRVIRARDGKFFAAKLFVPPTNTNKRRRDDLDRTWLSDIRREFTIPNVVQVFEFWETPVPMIIMAYYPDGNVTDANIVNEDRLVSSFGQILDGLSYLHPQGIVHRDLKPDNFLVQLHPFYKVVLADFGMAKIATNNAWLKTFCGSYKYAAPEVFPSLSKGYGPEVDVWSLGVITLEWIYGIPTAPEMPAPEKTEGKVPAGTWTAWTDDWTTRILLHLDDQESGPMFDILSRMLDLDSANRQPASACLVQGLRNGLFKRRAADGLIVYAGDPDDIVPSPEQEDDGIKTPKEASSRQTQEESFDSQATVIPYGA